MTSQGRDDVTNKGHRLQITETKMNINIKI